MIFTYKISFMTKIERDSFEKILKRHLDELTEVDEYDFQTIKRYTIKQIEFKDNSQ